MAGTGGKREGAGRKPGYKAKVAEAYNALLAKKVEDKQDELANSLIDKAIAGDITAHKEINDRLMGKASQPITGADGKDLFPTPLLANKDVPDNHGHAKDSETKQTNTGSPGGNVSVQDSLNTLIPD